MKEYIKDGLKLYNGDCMEILKQYADGYFEIGISDYYTGDAKEMVCEYLYDAFIGKGELEVWEETDQALINIFNSLKKLLDNG